MTMSSELGNTKRGHKLKLIENELTFSFHPALQSLYDLRGCANGCVVHGCAV